MARARSGEATPAGAPIHPGRVFDALAALAIAVGATHAAQLAWVSDDAYISFRYAKNLTDGLGLVYNVGERVEGYTNFLWTMWCALGIKLQVAIESWANASSIACFALTIALLVGFSLTRLRASRAAGLGALVVPVAGLGLAVHRDACVFATGGLETTLFTLLAVAGWLLLAAPLPALRGARGTLAAGVALGLATLTRPDGAIFAVLGGAFVLWTAKPRGRALLAYLGGVLALAAPFAAWKLVYYGDLLPNTFYAKSAAAGWYGQGLAYLGLYFAKYWVLLAALPIAGSLLPLRSNPSPQRAAQALAAAFAFVYTAYVVHVGGDFMFARLLIPATPFWLLTIELGLADWAARRRIAANLAALATVLLVLLMPYPFKGEGWVRGIVNEREFYQDEGRDVARRAGEDLGRLTAGLPVRVAISGKQAIVAYVSSVPVAIECSTGLTDAFIAHQKLTRRGRVGHEKSAPFTYLIDARRVHLYIGQSHILADSLRAYIPVIPLEYGRLKAMVLTWDPEIMPELIRRGAKVEDFMADLDRFIAEMPTFPDAMVADVYAKNRRFYFDGHPDPAREAPFVARLGAAR